MIINKYEIDTDFNENMLFVELPIFSTILSVEIINDNTGYVYALVDEKVQENSKHEVIWLGTEWELDKELIHKIHKYRFFGSHRTSNYTWHIWIDTKDRQERSSYIVENMNRELRFYNSLGILGDIPYQKTEAIGK